MLHKVVQREFMCLFMVILKFVEGTKNCVVFNAIHSVNRGPLKLIYVYNGIREK